MSRAPLLIALGSLLCGCPAPLPLDGGGRGVDGGLPATDGDAGASDGGAVVDGGSASEDAGTGGDGDGDASGDGDGDGDGDGEATDGGAAVDGGAGVDGGATPGDGDPCLDGIDNDGDGWADAADPDCALHGAELGLGAARCNDGVDNDGDAATDAADPACTAATDDEVLGPGPCLDVCRLRRESNGRTCALYDQPAGAFVEHLDQTALHHRAREYDAFLRERLMPQGGIFRTRFTDTSYTTPSSYAGARDAPIWTGTYLATQALRYQTTGAPDALEQVGSVIGTLHRWWTIAGSRGFLARYAAPETADPVTLALLPLQDDEVRQTAFQGEAWRWRGNISRDQYQGAFLGYSLAYEVLQDEALREAIRHDVVETVEQLMTRETVTMTFVINGIPLPQDVELEGVIWESGSDTATLEIDTNPFQLVDVGFVTFWPNAPEHLRQLSLLSWLPDIPQRGQAIQLGGMFAVALQVTEGVAAYAARRAAIQAYYDEHFDGWADYGAGWSDTGLCGAGYHGKNIAFTPAFNWVRLEQDPARKARLQREVLRDAMWEAVADHKNVWFASIYAAEAPPEDDVAGVIEEHADQLRLFPAAPNVAWGRDLVGQYPLDESCTDKPMSTVALDVDDRVPAIFMWERNPWNLVGEEDPLFVYPGHDYLVAYWMARRYGFIDDDTPGTCLVWR